MCAVTNTCTFIQRIEQVLTEWDVNVIEDYVIIISSNNKVHL